MAAVVMILAAAGLGISSGDASRLEGFVTTVDASRANPEFRQVGERYILAGSNALQARFFGVRAGRALYTLRRIPGLPQRLAANDHLALHYQHFGEGPLSAYLHLTAQQGVKDATGMLMELTKRPSISDEDARAFLRSFDVWPAVVTDAGAVASVRKLIADVNPAAGFAIRGPVDRALGTYLREIARARGFPLEPAEMAPDQQESVLAALDDHVKQADKELWRTKQVNDFLNGVWGQTFGRSYAAFARAVIWARLIGLVEIPALMGLAAWGTWSVRRWRARGTERHGDEVSEQAARGCERC